MQHLSLQQHPIAKKKATNSIMVSNGRLYQTARLLGLTVVMALIWAHPVTAIQEIRPRTEIESMLARPALNWLLGHRESDFGWGTQTPRALLALLRSGSNVAGWDPATLEGQLSVKQLDNELLCHLVRNRTAGQDISRIAQYVLTLSALCRPAKDFYGIDLIGRIENSEDAANPFTLAFNTLAVCSGGGHVKRRHIRKILELASETPSALHSIDVLAMVSMATSCVAKSSGKYHHLAEYLQQPLNFIASHQLSDGSFGNIHTTTMAIQALQLVDTLHLSINRSAPLTVVWKKQASVDWLRNNQRLDGSFGDVFTTSQVLLALSHRGYATINFNECHQPQPVLEPSTQSPATAAPKVETPLPTSKVDDVHFTYVIWIGQNRSERYSIQLAIPVNTSFFEAMKMAAEADPHFEFSSTLWPNGHYIHTISGHREQAIGFHFWLLFKTPFMPDPNIPPPFSYVAVAGVDDMYPENGDYYLFWFKDV